MAKIFVHGHTVRNGVIRQKVFAHPDLHRTAPGDFHGVFHGFRNVREQLDHFLGAAKILLVAEPTIPPGIVQSPAFSDADPGFVGFKIIRLKEVNVIGRHHRQTEFSRQLHTHVQTILVTGPPCALQLQVITVGIEVSPVVCTLPGQFRLPRQQGLANVPHLGAGQHNQALGTGFQPAFLDNRLAVALAFGIALGNDLRQVQVTIVVSGQQGQPERGFGLIRILQPDIGTDNGLDARAHGGLVETYQ